MTGDRAHRPPLALHVCCGPCATAVLERLLPEYDVEAVWYNPNLYPPEEHARRLAAMRAVATALGVPLTVLEYDPQRWEEACAQLWEEPEGGRRCQACFRLRLRRVAAYAAEGGVGLMATTLTVSPHKPASAINPVGKTVAGEYGVSFLQADFGKLGGFQRSVEMSRQWRLYRQRYCGCQPSLNAHPKS